LEEFQALLADYLVLAKEVFGEDKVFATLRDDVFIGIEAPASEAIALSQAFLARLKTSSWRCSVGISYGDVVVLSQKGVLNYQGVPLAMAKGLAKISGEGGIFLDDRTAALIGAEKPFAEAISIMLPHVGRPVRALELVQDGQTVGIKDRFQGRAHRLSQELRA
jgi:class 3 adenylate cyclase